MTELTAGRLRDALDYDPQTGVFTWKFRASKRIHVGDTAGYDGRSGYRRIRFDGVDYEAHRLAWLHVHGEWPAQFIDHINGVRSDNRIANLRAASPSVNAQNQRRARSDNTSGALGVQKTTGGAYRAHIGVRGKQVHLGTFPSRELAHSVYLKAKRYFHEGCTL